jgi:NAD-dependent DNA ligase
LIINAPKLDEEAARKIEQMLVEGKKLLSEAGSESNASNVAELLDEYRQELARRKKGVEEAMAKKEGAENLREQDRKSMTSEISSANDAKLQAEQELEKVRGELRNIQQTHRADMDELQQGVEKGRKELQDKLASTTEELGKANKRIAELDELLKARVGPKGPIPVDGTPTGPGGSRTWGDERELVDGRIVEVDNELRLAVIDIGRSTGVKRGLKFNVYRDSGLTGRHLKGQVIVKQVFELVSKAFVTYQRGIGQTFLLSGEFTEPSLEEVSKKIKEAGGTIVLEFGPNVNYLVIGKNYDKSTSAKAQEAKIPVLRYHLIESFLASSDTIQPGDVLINPVFSTTKKEQFVLLGDFATPQALLKERVREYGSEVAEAIGPTTDYIVVGANGTGETDHKEDFEKASKFGVTIMREEELLAFLTD